MSLLVKHVGKLMPPLSGWWSPTQLTKNCNQAMQSAVLLVIDFLPLFPCSSTFAPSVHQSNHYDYFDAQMKNTIKACQAIAYK